MTVENFREVNNMKTCPNCHNAVGDTDTFCNACGAALQADPAQSAPVYNTTPPYGANAAGGSPVGGAPVKYCQHCGNPCDINAAVCLKCGCAFAPQKPVKVDEPSIWLRIACFFIPVLGLIMYLVERDDRPKCAKFYGMAALISVILQVVFVVLFYIIFFVIFGVAFSTAVTDYSYYMMMF